MEFGDSDDMDGRNSADLPQGAGTAGGGGGWEEDEKNMFQDRLVSETDSTLICCGKFGN